MSFITSCDGAAVKVNGELVFEQTPVSMIKTVRLKNKSAYKYEPDVVRKLRSKFPNKTWYMKVGDDAYLIFDNLLLHMMILRVVANGASAIGNMLWGHQLSGSAGYLRTGLAVDLGL
jgi:hypothetical protein